MCACLSVHLYACACICVLYSTCVCVCVCVCVWGGGGGRGGTACVCVCVLLLCQYMYIGSSLSSEQETALLKALSPFEKAYLSRSLSRLLDAINQLFTSVSRGPPREDDIVTAIKVINRWAEVMGVKVIKEGKSCHEKTCGVVMGKRLHGCDACVKYMNTLH